MDYVCIRDCQYHSKLWKKGMILAYAGTPKPCIAECGGKDPKCPKCSGTNRSDPPHHFMPLDPPEVQAEKKAVETKAAEDEKEQLRGRIKELGSDYDNRWGVKALRKHLLKLEKVGRTKVGK